MPRWPKPILSVVLPVTEAHGSCRAAPHSARAGSYSLSVCGVPWRTEANGPFGKPCWVSTVTFSGFSYSGLAGDEFRVSDETGQTLHWECAGGCRGSDSGATLDDVEIDPVGKNVHSLRFDLFSEQARADSRLVFQFTSLPRVPVNTSTKPLWP